MPIGLPYFTYKYLQWTKIVPNWIGLWAYNILDTLRSSVGKNIPYLKKLISVYETQAYIP